MKTEDQQLTTRKRRDPSDQEEPASSVAPPPLPAVAAAAPQHKARSERAQARRLIREVCIATVASTRVGSRSR